MRQVRYSVATSLDGYIAGPNGEADWIVMDPELAARFPAFYAEIDTLLIGRRTFEAMTGGRKPTRRKSRRPAGGPFAGFRQIVCSTTLDPADHPDVEIARDPAAVIAELRGAPGKDIWLFGGGGLFRSLVDLGLVDRVEVGVIPVLLGGGVPLLPPGGARHRLALEAHRVYPATGTVSLDYAVTGGAAARRSR